MESRTPDAKERTFIERTLRVPIYEFSDMRAYLRVGCEKVWASFRACHLTASVLLSTKFKVQGKELGADVQNPELNRLLSTPNPFDSWAELLYLWVYHMKLTGRAYWLKDEMDYKGRPKYLYPLMPQYVAPIPHPTEKISGYIYRVNGQEQHFERDEIIHFRRPHPMKLHGALGDVAASQPLYREYIARNTLEEKFLANGAMPSGILTKKEAEEDEEEWAKLKKWWKSEYEGERNVGKTAFLNGEWAYTKLGLTHSEMQSIENEKWSIEQIFTNHGVPLSMAGIKEAANYACLPAGELVTTQNGVPVPIEQLEAGDVIVQFDPAMGSVEVPVEAIIEQGDAEVLELVTDSRTLRASNNHPVLCVNRTAGTGRNGKRVEVALEYKYVEDLCVGDIVVCLDELMCKRNKCIPIENRDPIDAAYALGQYVGDGSGASLTRIRIGGFTIATHEKEGYQSVVADAFKAFGFVPSVNPTSIRFQSADFARDMVSAGFGGRSGEKRIPEWVFSLPVEQQLHFAAGLIDADGCVAERGSITFAVANKELASDFKHLLMCLGVPTSNLRPCEQFTNYGDVVSWRFTAGIVRENKRLPLRHPKKAQRLAVAESKGDKAGKGIPGAYRLPSDLVLPEGYGVQKVRSIRSLGKMPVYDLATTGYHNFLASGIVTHNTARQDEINFRKYEIVPLLDLLVGKLNGEETAVGKPVFVRAFSSIWELAYELSGLIDVEQVVKDYGPLVDRGALTPNQLRELCGLERDEGNPLLDQYFVNRNRVPIEFAGFSTPTDAERERDRRENESILPEGEEDDEVEE